MAILADTSHTHDSIVNIIESWLKNKISNAKASGGIVGLSGGIDSALVSVLLHRAVGNNMLAVMMPCHSQQQDLQDAMMLVQQFELPNITIDLSDTYDMFLKNFHNSEINVTKLATANLKPRLRMMTLYLLAQSKNYLVCGTSNKAELTVGYFTKHGDSGSDLLPIGALRKEQVIETAKYLNIPESIIYKAPSAGLWPGQTDEKEMGLTYRDIDNFLKLCPIPESVQKKIEEKMYISAHKREMPPVCPIE